MDAALRDVARARREIDELSTVLRNEGPNAEARKVRLTLELADDARYCGALADRRGARERLPVEHGRSLMGLAEIAEAAGRHAEAMSLLDQAAALFQQHGITVYLQQVLARKELRTA